MARSKKTDTAKTTAAAATAEAKTTKTASAAPKTTRVRKTVSISLQYGGMEWTTDVLTERAVVAWAAEHGQKKTAAKDIKLYVKPEENMVYYVINGDSGSFTLYFEIASFPAGFANQNRCRKFFYSDSHKQRKSRNAKNVSAFFVHLYR